MKKMIWIIIVLMCLLLGACNEAKTALQAPQNLHVEGSQLIWDAVPHAQIYHLLFNEKPVTSETNTYDLSGLDVGEYEIQIKSSAEGYLNSPYSEFFTYSLFNETPKGMMIDSDLLTWDKINSVIQYVIKINSDIYETYNNSLSLRYLKANQSYLIRVKAIFPFNESAYSDPILYENYDLIDQSLDIDFDKASEDNLIISLGELVGSNLQDVDSNHYSLNGHELTFYNSYLRSLDSGEQSFSLITSDGILKLNLQLMDSRKPHLLSNSTIVYDNQNVVLLFELYGGEITNISGNDITSEDYEISGNHVTINRTYITNKFTNEPTRNLLVLSYSLSGNSNVVIGYIFINKE